MRGWIARCVERTHFARSALEEEADLSPFKERPSARLVVGLVILALSFTVGWPVVLLCGLLAVWFSNPYIVLIGGPAAYGFSWLLWAVSMYLTGHESYKYGRIFLRWWVRRLVEEHGSGRRI